LKVAETSVEWLKAKVRAIFREGRGRGLNRVIEELNKPLRGWMQYFRLVGVKIVFEELDGWIRRKVRCLIWLQWKRCKTRARELIRRGLEETRAWKSAYNGRDSWWSAGSSQMREAFPKSFFDRLVLVSLLDQLRKFKLST
jgi:RNA-directed DNA polymerase